MNDGQLSSLTRAMIEAAKADAPSAAARAKVWTQVSGAAGVAAAGTSSVGAGGLVAGGAGAAKLLVVGALLGGAVTVGLAATVLRFGVGSAPTGVGRVSAAPATAAIGGMGASRQDAPAVASSAWTPVLSLTATASATPAAATATPTPISAPPVRPRAPADALEREAQLVSEARGALGRGDAKRALQAVRGARSLPSHQLGPEELAVESQALRALGRAGDADQVDETLRAKFPESALAR